MTLGHNNPPSPIDDALEPYGDAIQEAENWLDGSPVETESQMNAVDTLIRDLKAAKKAVVTAQKFESTPYHDAWKTALAKYTPTIDDLTIRIDGLVAAVDPFKRKLADEKAEAERIASEVAKAAEQAAQAAMAQASASDYESQVAAQAAMKGAQDAQRAAQAAAKDGVKGMRTVSRYAIEDGRAAINWIAQNDKTAMKEFLEDYVKRNHKTQQIAGVKTWTEKEAF